MSWLPAVSEPTCWMMLVGGISNTSCAILGCYLVLRRLSLLGDAISHAVLPGIVVAFLLSGSLGLVPMLFGAMFVGMLTTFLTETLHRYGKVPQDAGMGVVFTSLFALGVILITRYASNVDLDPQCVLYGLIEFVAFDTVPLGGWEVPRVLAPLGLALAVTLAFVLLCWKELKISAFDPGLATAMGISAVVMHYLLMAAVAAVTVAAFEAVGSILVVAMLIVPAATAQLLTDRLRWMIVWAVAVGWISALVGCWGASYLNTSAAGMMAVVAGGQFLLAVVLAPRHGVLSRAWHAAALSLRIIGEDLVALLYRKEEAAAGGHPPAVLDVATVVRAGGGGLAAWLALARLWRRGEVRASQRHIRLTEKGRGTAQSLVRAHRLWEVYLGEHFELPLDHLHAPAERIEHYLGPQLQERLAKALDRPGRDPHGREIPPSAP